MGESFKKLSEYHKHNEEEIDARFNAVDTRFDEVDGRFSAADARFDRIEATMATKEDMAALEVRLQGNMDAMEGRILDAFKQLLVMVDSRLPPASQFRQ